MILYEYIPPPTFQIDKCARDLIKEEKLSETYRVSLLLARIKAAAILTRCPETVDVINDILNRFYLDYRFFPIHLEILQKDRLDVYLLVDKLIKNGKAFVDITRKGNARKSRRRLPRKNRTIIIHD